VHDTLNPVEVFESLKILLQPSASFAIHSSYVQPLVQLLEKLHQSKDTLNAKIEELWTREL
jgi:tRNA A58 N-methylase Trm61